MADTKKETERAALHSAIWSIADDLRGTVDGWDFKNYVLGIMFYRYISENLTNYINGRQREIDESFDYVTLSDEDAEQARQLIVETKGFFILPSQLFCNVQKRAKEDEKLNVTLDRILKSIEDSAKGTDSERDFVGLFADVDVNSPKLGGTVINCNKKIVQLLDGVASMQLSADYKDNTIDTFGDAYEYLMGMYAANAGKSGGEYFTPQEVSELLARLVVAGKTKLNKVYDPACGSGSLLFKAAKL